MSDTNLNLYKIFCTVAECKNYRQASEKLYLTESTISSHITNLEKKLNFTLFYRERDGLTLTEAGKELYESMNDKIKDIEFLENAVIQNNDIEKAKITIGCPSHISISYLAKCITKARKEYPNLKINLIGANDYTSIVELVRKHEINFAIMDIIPQELKSEINVKPLKKTNNIFIYKDSIKIKNIKELEKYKYILNYNNSSSTKELLETLKKYDVNIEADIQSDITEMRVEEAIQKQGIAYVMKETAEEAIKNKEVYEVELPIELPKTTINLVYMEKYLTKFDKIFIKKFLNE